ncbi:hypothetical protein ACIQNG_32355 [Streptomyces sp. NPDC091377]|uniref:hypothetical protein n=1 Tax=Streptomyces sp. NPDC091377 TaxID=3365995 RepID=UPI00382FEF0D
MPRHSNRQGHGNRQGGRASYRGAADPADSYPESPPPTYEEALSEGVEESVREPVQDPVYSGQQISAYADFTYTVPAPPNAGVVPQDALGPVSTRDFSQVAYSTLPYTVGLGFPHGGGQEYGGQPYAGQPYAGQPYAGQPYAGQGVRDDRGPYSVAQQASAQPSGAAEAWYQVTSSRRRHRHGADAPAHTTSSARSGKRHGGGRSGPS